MARRKNPAVQKVEDLSPQNKALPVVHAPVKKVGQPAKKLPLVKLRVFIASSGLKPDQTAGFESYARNMNLGPMSMPDWMTALDSFFSRPV